MIRRMDAYELPDFLASLIGQPFATTEAQRDRRRDEWPYDVWPVVDEGDVVREFVTFAELASSGVYWRPLDSKLDEASWSDMDGIVAFRRGEELSLIHI